MSGMRFIVRSYPPLPKREVEVLLTMDERGNPTWVVGRADTHEKLAAGMGLFSVLTRAFEPTDREMSDEGRACLEELTAGVVEGFEVLCRRAQPDGNDTAE